LAYSIVLEKLACDLLQSSNPRKALHTKDDVAYLYSAYNALSQVWAYLMALGVSKEKMEKARKARDMLEELLAEKAR
jgi:hypothetical protein